MARGRGEADLLCALQCPADRAIASRAGRALRFGEVGAARAGWGGGEGPAKRQLQGVVFFHFLQQLLKMKRRAGLGRSCLIPRV